MSRTLLFASVALMLASTIAEAQSPPSQPGQTRPAPGSGSGPRPPSVQPPRPGGPQVQPSRPGGPQVQPPRPGAPQIQPARPGNPGGPQIQPPRPGNGYRPPVKPPRPPGNGWNRPPVAAPHYRYPHGYNYRRYNVGLLLPRIFLSSTYYYSNYALLGLPRPPSSNYRWVRYGPDLLLVDRRNGRIRDIRYNVFR